MNNITPIGEKVNQDGPFAAGGTSILIDHPFRDPRKQRFPMVVKSLQSIFYIVLREIWLAGWTVDERRDKYDGDEGREIGWGGIVGGSGSGSGCWRWH